MAEPGNARQGELWGGYALDSRRPDVGVEPLGANDVPEAADEYDSYIGGIYDRGDGNGGCIRRATVP